MEHMKIKHVSMILTIYSGAIFFLIFMSSSAHAFPYKGLDIKIQGTIAEIYNDNVTFAKKEDKKEDFITTLTLDLGVKYEGRRRALEFTGRINRQFHTIHSDIKSSSENLTLNFKNEFSKYDRIRLTDTFSHTHVPASIEEEFGRIRGRRESYSNNFNLNFTRDISEHFTVIAKYANGLNKISREEGDSRDSYLNRLGIVTEYMHSTATTFLLSYTFSTTKYEDAGDTSAHSIATGMRQYITRRLYFDGKVGIDFITSVNNKDTVKNVIEVSLTDEIDETTVSKLTFVRRDRTVSDTDDIFSNWRITGSLKKQLSERLSGSLLGFYGHGEFVSSGITDRLFGANTAVSYEFKEGFRGRLTYIYSALDSTDETREYARNTLSMGLSKAF